MKKKRTKNFCTKTFIRNNGEVHVAYLDRQDAHLFEEYSWAIKKDRMTCYVYGGKKGPGFRKRKRVFLHVVLMDPPPGLKVDHRDGNGLNNCRVNLRLCTQKQNVQYKRCNPLRKKSRFKCVFWHKANQNWTSAIFVDGRSIHLGSFSSELAAAKAYNVAAKKYFGAFAKLNVFEDEK